MALHRESFIPWRCLDTMVMSPPCPPAYPIVFLPPSFSLLFPISTFPSVPFFSLTLPFQVFLALNPCSQIYRFSASISTIELSAKETPSRGNSLNSKHSTFNFSRITSYVPIFPKITVFNWPDLQSAHILTVKLFVFSVFDRQSFKNTQTTGLKFDPELDEPWTESRGRKSTKVRIGQYE